MLLLLYVYFGLLAFSVCKLDPYNVATYTLYKRAPNLFKIKSHSKCSQSDTSLYCDRLPSSLPVNVTHFYLKKRNAFRVHYISHATFLGENWNNLKVLHLHHYITISGNAMTNLANLEELHIFADSMNLKNRSFAGLDNLKILTISGILSGNLADVIGSKHILPNLEALFIKDMNLRGRSRETLTAIMDRPSKSLNMNFVITNELEFIRLLWFSKFPEKINISRSTFNNKEVFHGRCPLLLGSFTHRYFYILLSATPEYYNSIEQRYKRLKSRWTMKDMKIFDASYAFFPVIKEFVQCIFELKSTDIRLPLEIVTLVSRAETVNISYINHHYSTIKLNSVRVNIDQYFSRSSPTRELVITNNRLQYLDVVFLCNESKLERLDLSSNVIEFLQPNICSCCSRLNEIDLSKNNLFKMVDKNYFLFGHLFSLYKNLKNVKLSFNKLTEIPTDMFHENIDLEQIDLSNNALTQIKFNLGHLLNLKTLNLKNNRILMFDHESLTIVKSINTPCPLSSKCFGILKMGDNPNLCSECKTLSFINWFATTHHIDRTENNIFCKNHEGIHIRADQNAAQHVQEVCDKPRLIQNVIILSSVVPVSTILLMVIFIITCIRRRREKLKRTNIEEKIKLIQQNQLDTQFVVFLSYSSEDTDFLNEYVYNPLKFHLQEKLQTERDIICLGDRHFKLGKPINDEMVRSLQQSAVVLLLLSRNFCRSEFCRMEFDHALFMKKPFIIMVMGEVDINEMVPSLQEFFKRNTRLLWEKDGDKFLMKTSWYNVCSSILELI